MSTKPVSQKATPATSRTRLRGRPANTANGCPLFQRRERSSCSTPAPCHLRSRGWPARSLLVGLRRKSRRLPGQGASPNGRSTGFGIGCSQTATVGENPNRIARAMHAGATALTISLLCDAIDAIDAIIWKFWVHGTAYGPLVRPVKVISYFDYFERGGCSCAENGSSHGETSRPARISLRQRSSLDLTAPPCRS